MLTRSTWLKEIRRTAEDLYTVDALTYDDHWGTVFDPTHQDFITKFLSLCPPGSTIFDAACGTGKYGSLILESRRKVHDIDQSPGVLARAHEKFPTVSTEKTGLQEIHYQEAFDGAICMDAMENIFPENWLTVLENIHRAIKPKGYFYFTVELASDNDVEQAFGEATQMGFPVVRGEWTQKGEYHYYPKIEQVKEWLNSAGFVVIEEKSAPFGEPEAPLDAEANYIGEGYYHILAQKQ